MHKYWDLSKDIHLNELIIILLQLYIVLKSLSMHAYRLYLIANSSICKIVFIIVAYILFRTKYEYIAWYFVEVIGS